MKREVTFVLVRPCYGGNIGSAARALKNMGFSKLALVQPAVPPTDAAALKMAVSAADLLQKASIYNSLEAAIRPLNYLVGTSRRMGRHRRNFSLLHELPSLLPSTGKIGILFGSEEKGLTNEEIASCHRVLTIPASPRYPSLNLAQSVMVVAYEMRKIIGWDNQVGNFEAIRRRASKPFKGARRVARRFPASEEIAVPKKQPPWLSQPLATIADVEAMFSQLEETLAEIGFFPHGNPFMVMRTLRNLFGRSGLTGREIRIMRGICRQIGWYSKNGLRPDLNSVGR